MSKLAVLSSENFQRQELQLLRGIRDSVNQSGLPDPSAVHTAQQARISRKLDADQVKVTNASKKVAAFDELRAKVSTLESAARKLVNPGGNPLSDVFQMKTANITTNESPQINCVEVIAESTAALGQHSVVVNRLATADTKTICSRNDLVNGYIGFDSDTVDVVTGAANFFCQGTFDINGVANSTITLAAGDTLQVISGKINATTANTGVSASVIHGDNGFLLKLTSTETGVAKAFTIQDPNLILASVAREGVTVPGIIRHVDIAPAGGFITRTTSVVTVSTADTFHAGTFQINGTDITLRGDGNPVPGTSIPKDTLDDVATIINEQTSSTGVKASITGTSATGFHLVLDLVGTTHNQIKIVDDNVLLKKVLSGLQVTNTAAQDASIVIDNIETTSSKNTISNAIPGITFTLKQPNTIGKSATVAITADVQRIVKEGVEGFIDTYNALSLFIAQQTERDNKGQYKSTAILGHNIPSSVISFLQGIESQVSGLPNGSSSLLDIGLGRVKVPADVAQNIPEHYILDTVDQATLDKTIAQNFDLIRRIFTTSLSGVNKDKLQVINSTAATTLTAFTLDVTANTNTARITPIGGGGAINCTYTGNATSGIIEGVVGTVTEGLKLVYTSSTGGALETLNSIILSRGVASTLYDQLTPYDGKDGILSRNRDVFGTTLSKAEEAVVRDQEEFEKLLEKQEIERAKIDQLRMQMQMTENFLKMMSSKD